MGHANTSAATKRHTEIVFPKRRGVEILPRHGTYKNVMVCENNDQQARNDAVTDINAQDLLINTLPCVHLE